MYVTFYRLDWLQLIYRYKNDKTFQNNHITCIIYLFERIFLFHCNYSMTYRKEVLFSLISNDIKVREGKRERGVIDEGWQKEVGRGEGEWDGGAKRKGVGSVKVGAEVYIEGRGNPGKGWRRGKREIDSFPSAWQNNFPPRELIAKEIQVPYSNDLFNI